MNNIVIVCDDKNISETLKSNLMLLRKFDFVFSCDILNAEEIICQNKPNLVIFYSDNVSESDFSFINKISSVPVICVSEVLDDETLVNLYESGISDYVLTSCSKTEFLVKVMLCLKKSTEIKKGKNNCEILKRLGILNKDNDYYSKKYTPAVFKSLMKKYISDGVELSMMAIAPDINYKNKCSLDFLASVLKQNLREDDLIGFGVDKLYVLLPNTNLQGTLNVYNKIKNVLKDSYTISSGILKADKNIDYNLVIKKLDEALDDALSLTNSAVVQEDMSAEEPMNWLDKSNKKHKNFKLFKKVFMKKLETVITPVFYQKQQVAEQRLFETKISQYVDEKKSVFSLEKGDIKSLVEITYPGAVKINIDISDNINGNSEPERKSFELSQINENLIGDILDKLIRDFQRADK